MKVLTCKALLFCLALMPAVPLLADQNNSWFSRYVTSWIPACSSVPTWVDKIPLCLTRLFIDTQNKRASDNLDALSRQAQHVSQRVDTINTDIKELKGKAGEYSRTFEDLKEDVVKRVLQLNVSAESIALSQKDLIEILKKRREKFATLSNELAEGVANLRDLNIKYEDFKHETLASIKIIRENQADNFQKLKKQVEKSHAQDKAELKSLQETAVKQQGMIKDFNDQLAQMQALYDETKAKRALLDAQIHEVHSLAKNQEKQLGLLVAASNKKSTTQLNVNGKF